MFRSSLAIMEPLIALEDLPPDWVRSAAATYEVMGDVFTHRGESERAVDSYRRALALREQLAASLEDVSWQSELERAYRRTSEQLLHMGRAADAYDTAEQYLLATSLAPDTAPDKPKRVAHALATLCWSALFANKVPRAKWVGQEATTLDPGLALAELNYAHALMYAGDIERARKIYLDGARGDSEVAADWRKKVRDDFAVLTERGLRHPLMAEIEGEIKE
jgi:predicted Zn-dependent protease